MPRATFVYFDLGNVVVHFSHEAMVRQLAQAANVAEEAVSELVFANGLQHELETGKVDTKEFHRRFCEALECHVELDELVRAASDIFSLNTSVVPLIGQLQICGIPLGILSNTCEAHWDWVRSRYSVLKSAFQSYILSYEIGAAKPEAAIFEAAIQQAGTPAEQIFYTDDRPEFIEAAQKLGIQAQPFVSTNQLALELRAAGLQFNY